MTRRREAGAQPRQHGCHEVGAHVVGGPPRAAHLERVPAAGDPDDLGIGTRPDRCLELIDRLESRKYLPQYLNTTVRTTTLDYVTTLTFEQNGADYIFSFCGDRAMDVKGIKTRTVQLKNYEAFQSSLLALLLGQV